MIYLIPTILFCLAIASLAYGFSVTYIFSHIFIITVPGCIIWLAIDKYTTYQHPLRKKIMHVITTWEKESGKTVKQLNMIINLSLNPFDLTLSPSIEEHLSMTFSECTLNGYIHDNGQFYLSINHPSNQLLDMASLWDEINKTKLRFKSLYLCLAPDQLSTLEQKLDNEWRFIAKILHESKRVILMLNQLQLAQSMHYIKEFGTLPSALTVTPTIKTNQLFHQISKQLDIFIETIFNQRLELCIYPPIDEEQKYQLFLVPLTIANLKTALLSTSEYLVSSGISLQSICFQLEQQPISRQPIDYYRWLTKLAITFTGFALCLSAINYSTEHRIQRKISHLSDAELINFLEKIDSRYSFDHLEYEQLQRLRISLLKSQPSDLLNLYETFLNSEKSTNRLKIWTIHQLTNNQLTDHQAKFLARKWHHTSNAFSPTPMSSIASAIPPNYFSDVCKVTTPDAQQDCMKTLSNIQAYNKIETQLITIESTLLPINHDNHRHAAKQLSYLTQQPHLIGEEALKTLTHVALSLDSVKHQHLLLRVSKIRHTIELLRSKEGQYILQQLLKLHTLLGDIKSDEEAHLSMQLAYQSDDHPLQQLHIIEKSLPEHITKWLSPITSELQVELSNKANRHFQTIWNSSIKPSLEKAIQLYPFNLHASESILPEHIYQLFGHDQAIDQFLTKYLASYLQEEDGLLTLKPFDLGIEISNEMLILIMYNQVIQSSMDIKPNHLHAAWAVNIVSSSHPVDEVILKSGKQSLPLSERESQILHWNSKHPIAIDVKLQSGETITLSKDTNWGILELFSMFKSNNGLNFTYKNKENNWHITLKLAPQQPINLLSQPILQQLAQDLHHLPSR